jgi:autotransporter-associated beta strand protein
MCSNYCLYWNRAYPFISMGEGTMNIGLNYVRKTVLLFAGFLGVLGLQRQYCSADNYSYSIQAVNGNTEYRFFYDLFHFGTIICDPQDALIFRPHPDQFDINGWGTSEYLNPFLAGGAPSQGAVTAVSASSQGIQISLNGQINHTTLTDYGNFSYNLLFTYDQTYQKIAGNGSLQISLPGSLSSAGADLNLSRISSNVLTDVPLQTGSTGGTGDMSQALVQYAPAGDPRDFTWYPPILPAHYPQDFSRYLSIEAVGTVNVVDTIALGYGYQIAIARKPTLQLSLQEQSSTLGNLMNFGGAFDTTKASDFTADNIGMNHLVEQNRTSQTSLNFSVNIQSEPGIGLGRNLVWSQTGGIWDTTVANHAWLAGDQDTFFILGDHVTFGNAGVGIVVIASSGIAPDAINVVHNFGNYVFSGGTIGGNTGLQITGSGTLTLKNINVFTGDTVIQAGTVVLDAQGQISQASLINNNAAFIVYGDHVVGDITGTGSTLIENGELTVRSIKQDVLSMSPGTKLIIESISFNPETGRYGAFPVPEPVVSAWIIVLCFCFFNSLAKMKQNADWLPTFPRK